VTVVAGEGSAGVAVGVWSGVEEVDPGDEDPGDEEPGVPPTSLPGAGPPVMMVIEPSDWLQAAGPPSGAAASSSKAPMNRLCARALRHVRSVDPVSPILPPRSFPVDRQDPPGDRPFDRPAGLVFTTTLTIYLPSILSPITVIAKTEVE
jgi:hypothetical protein